MGSNALKAAEHAVSRLETGRDGQELLLKRPASIWRNLSTSLPLRVAVGLDDLAGSNRVAGEVLCTKKKRKEREKTQS